MATRSASVNSAASRVRRGAATPITISAIPSATMSHHLRISGVDSGLHEPDDRSEQSMREEHGASPPNRPRIA